MAVDVKESPLFWADKIAREVIDRKKFRYLDKQIPTFDKFVVKTSASISGVLHIGRLSDTIRGESVVRALIDSGVKAELIWVAEDMDPLRKVPKGVPEGYEKYIGMPVTDIPDPFGCHNSYAEHNKAEYFKVIDQFVGVRMKKYSMREEYKKGSFRPYIKKILENIDKVREILNKYRTTPLEKNWSPWTPVCENCGKIITPRIIGVEEGIVKYVCEDYAFKSYTAKGCGYKGDNDPLEGNGKLMWKSEWAAQWARWKVVAEGAGKEYQVPMSAWWVNAEIVEHILSFPMPVPIFYEHLMIDGVKMSASLGNVVYPKDWLEVAPAELLRFLYNKKLMKTRSFSWRYLPNLYDEYDRHADVYFDRVKVANEKEREHIKRLFEISQLGKPKACVTIPFSFAAIIAQIHNPAKSLDKAIELLRFTGHVDKVGKEDKEEIRKRLMYARRWAEKYAPEDMKIRIRESVPPKLICSLSDKEKNAIKVFAKDLAKEWNEQSLQYRIFEIAKENGIDVKRFFKICYQIILGKDYGPKLGPFILAVGKEKIIALLSEVGS